MKSLFLRTISASLLLASTMIVALPGQAAELLMLEQEGCYWCERWDAEIGDIYPKTTESKIAPLRRIDIHDPWPQDLVDIKPDYFTPTFVLVHDGKEVGRLRGYPGDDFFWPLLEELLNKLPEKPDLENS